MVNCSADDVLTRESLEGLEGTDKGGVAVKVGLISPDITARKTAFNARILRVLPLTLGLCGIQRIRIGSRRPNCRSSSRCKISASCASLRK